MKASVALLLLISLSLAWCCSPVPGATNIARNGEASQSSNYLSNPNDASLAIDGSKNIDWNYGFCSHTRQDKAPWWRLDMKQSYRVNVVVVSGRSDCCLERLKGAEVRIGDSPNNNNPVCDTITDISGPITSFCCNGMEGRYLSIVIPGRYEYLSVCEVEVYGDPVVHVCW
ncbi:pentraxin fusion protein-like [Pyxicephalus adspersus]|uniref:pentraxin fusion protein-like n=1 Tax=Pyxicephalus adspersus TaxID=30357 RepID=UPI003B5BBF1C